MLKALLALNTALNPPEGQKVNEDEVVAIAQDFTAGNDGMRTYRQVYVAGRLVRKGVALSTVIDLMDQATRGVEAALSDRPPPSRYSRGAQRYSRAGVGPGRHASGPGGAAFGFVGSVARTDRGSFRTGAFQFG
jgi:hypothetical protein